MIIDATNLIVGRLASFAAKKAILGENVDIVNCEKAVMTGKRNNILNKYKEKRSRGTPQWGPFIPRLPDRLVRRVVRGMLRYKTPRGKAAFKRVMCHVSVPEKFNNEKLKNVDGANVDKLPNLKYISIREICKNMGGKL